MFWVVLQAVKIYIFNKINNNAAICQKNNGIRLKKYLRAIIYSNHYYLLLLVTLSRCNRNFNKKIITGVSKRLFSSPNMIPVLNRLFKEAGANNAFATNTITNINFPVPVTFDKIKKS